MLSDSPTFKKYEYSRAEGAFDFYRCYKCYRIFTREMEVAAFALMSKTPGGSSGICPCGSLKYSPSWPVRLEWLKWSVVRYTAKLTLARGLAPWLDKHMPKALPLVERLVRFKEA